MMKRRSFLKAGAAAGISVAGFPAIIRAAGAAEPVTIVTPFGFIPDFIEIMNGVSGGHFAKQGIDAKIVGAHGSAQSVQQVVAGQAQYGVTLISEMLPNKGVTVWPLPDELQMTTIYTAAIATHAENALDAGALLNELRGPKGRDASIKAGLKPVIN